MRSSRGERDVPSSRRRRPVQCRAERLQGGRCAMALSLSCACGARFDVDDAQAGKEVVCPECQQSVKAPAASPAVVTTDWALASVVLALAGAFTVVGSLAAVFC